ncbi:GNAT family N-acetyltransferase [Herbidospora mongoliensis]|uniref:GNAT family N-acetyltransferase n=1 Tax=Herbidospora mongoliensis TaxID=688067 RepID=UPI000A62591F|nr:GNAT family N-acetyltransferase [Herbidospora mongoliensis]
MTAVHDAFHALPPGGQLVITTDIPSAHELHKAGFIDLEFTPGRATAHKPWIGAGMHIRPMQDRDSGQILSIYQAGLDSGNASFETSAPPWEQFSTSRLPVLRYVAADAVTDEVTGWIAVSATSSRPVYSGVVEHSVYVHPGRQGLGIGRALLRTLLTASEDLGYWTVQSGVFPENTASLTLHESVGFRRLGTRERVGCHRGVWRDVILIERRSPRSAPALERHRSRQLEP